MNVNRPNELDRDLMTMIGSRLSRRTVLSAVFLAPALAAVLAACGDNTKLKDSSPSSTASDGDTTTTGITATTEGTATTTVDTTATTESVDTTASTTADTTAGTTAETTVDTEPSAGIEHPTGADDVILRYGYVGGFVQPGYAFVNVPNVLVTGDGRLIQPGVTTLQFPGPLLPALQVRTISEEAIQAILAIADGDGLLAPPPDYSAETNVADAADTRVELNAKGGSFVHQAPALGFQDPAESKVRILLHDFTIGLDDIETLVGKDNLGEPTPLEATTYRLQARPLTADDLAGYTEEPKPTEVPWPTDLGVTLASAVDCAEVDAAKVGTLFSDANQLTFFVEDGTTYMVAAVTVLPGDTC
jgi:hypothetical protein